jgi:hypothetical protein
MDSAFRQKIKAELAKGQELRKTALALCKYSSELVSLSHEQRELIRQYQADIKKNLRGK